MERSGIMLKKRSFIVVLTFLMLFGWAGFFTSSNTGSGNVDVVSAATVNVGDEIGRQKICVVIETLTVIDVDDLEDEINIIEDEEGSSATIDSHKDLSAYANINNKANKC